MTENDKSNENSFFPVIQRNKFASLIISRAVANLETTEVSTEQEEKEIPVISNCFGTMSVRWL